jgi:drug/metabolite transporter (DMT)-like permease
LPDPASSRCGIALITAAMACFALSDVAAKRLTGAGLPVLEVVWFRYLALALSVGWFIVRGQRLQRSSRPLLQAGRALMLVASTALFNAGLAYLPLAAATALVFSSPLFVTLLSVLILRERVEALRWVWVLLGFGGVLLVANPGPASFDPAALFPIASSAAWAVAMILTRRVVSTDSTFTTLGYSCGIGVAVLTLLLPAAFRMPSAVQLVELVAMGACWSMAQWLVVLAYSRSEASQIAPFAYSQLVWANLLSVVLLVQFPEPLTLAGTAVILAAGLGAARLRRSAA